MDLIHRDMPVLKLGLHVSHETRWAAEEVVGIDILDQAGHERAVDTSFAIIVRPTGAGSTVGDVHVNI